MKRTFVAVALALLPVLAGAPGLRAQGAPSVFGEDTQLVDRIAAVVGDSVILVSQIQEEVLRLRAQGVEPPRNPDEMAALQEEVLERLINQMLIVQAALRDSLVTVDEERVEQVVQEELQSRVRSFGSQGALQQALEAQGLTFGEYRETLRAQARRDLLQQRYLAMRARELPEPTITESELREVFETGRAQLNRRPAEVRLAQILVRPRPSDSARAEARAEAERILEMIRSEELEFQDAARRFSDDQATRPQGGDLGWFRRGEMVRDFEEAAFTTREGRVTDVVETPFGFHIIQVERVRGAERKARHILIRPETSDRDLERARLEAADAARALREGVDPEEVQSRVDAAQALDTATIPVPRLPEALPPELADTLVAAPEGAVLGPVETGSGTGAVLRVVEVLGRREAGEYTFEDVRERIRGNLQEQRLIERIIADLRERAYVDIRT